jgi:aerobic C4-dicarboxylate transport protein
MKTIPIESVALLLGIDRFMSECRSITNFIGNSVATIAVSRWEKEVTAETLRENLRNPPPLIPHAEEEPKLSAGH